MKRWFERSIDSYNTKKIEIFVRAFVKEMFVDIDKKLKFSIRFIIHYPSRIV